MNHQRSWMVSERMSSETATASTVPRMRWAALVSESPSVPRLHTATASAAQ